jgi:hypothetical protein
MQILLDSNIWRYISDADAAGALQLAVSRTRNRIVIAPSVLYEALRVQDVAVRRKLADVMTRPAWYRLMPDAYSESEELKTEIRRLRPKWMRERPDLERFKRFRSDWKKRNGGFWSRARNTPDSEHNYLRLAERDTLDLARANARIDRKSFIGSEHLHHGVPLKSVKALLNSPETHRSRDAIEMWRLSACSSMAMLLGEKDSPYLDWLAGEVELQLISLDAKAWEQFWFYEVEAPRLPRMWLRWAMEYMQLFQKVTDGTPVDAQIASNLAEVDLFVSADKRFIEMCQRCQREAPFSVAEAKSVGAGKEGLEELFDLVSQV